MAGADDHLDSICHASRSRRQASELRVYDEQEIVVGGRPLVPGDMIGFLASESVLEGSIVPDLFSSLREVTRETKKVNQ